MVVEFWLLFCATHIRQHLPLPDIYFWFLLGMCLSITAQKKRFTLNSKLTGLRMEHVCIKISICSSLQSLDNSNNISWFSLSLINHQGKRISVTEEKIKCFLWRTDPQTDRQAGTTHTIIDKSQLQKVCMNIFVCKKNSRARLEYESKNSLQGSKILKCFEKTV